MFADSWGSARTCQNGVFSPLQKARATAVCDDLTAEELMALAPAAFDAIRHVGVETSRERSAHIAQIISMGRSGRRSAGA